MVERPNLPRRGGRCQNANPLLKICDEVQPCADCVGPWPEVISSHDQSGSYATLAFAPNDRGLSLRHCTSLSAAGPGQILWSGLPSSRSSDGDHGGYHCAAITVAEPLR